MVLKPLRLFVSRHLFGIKVKVLFVNWMPCPHINFLKTDKKV